MSRESRQLYPFPLLLRPPTSRPARVSPHARQTPAGDRVPLVIDIPARRQVRALDQRRRVPVEVHAGAGIAMGGRDDPLPVGPAQNHRMPGPSVVGGPRQRGWRHTLLKNPANYGLSDVGKVDQDHNNGGCGSGQRGNPCPEGRAEASAPVVGRRNDRGPALQQGSRLRCCRPKNHHDRGAASRSKDVDATGQPVVNEGLGCAHATSRPCGEQQTGWGACATSGGIEGTRPDGSAPRYRIHVVAARLIALRIRQYVPQRQTFMILSMSASEGLGLLFSSAAACMICPDWQKPHCATSSSIQACCTGCRPPSGPRPSIVVTFFPTTSAAVSVHT